MAISKEGHIEDNKATPITYWRYRKFSKIVEGVMRPEAPRDLNGNWIPQTGIVILMDGYSTKENRDNAKVNSLSPDKTHEFIIINWVERLQSTRPATLAEKKELFPKMVEQDYTDEQIDMVQSDVLLEETLVPHNDFDLYMSKINTPEEAETVYSILKAHPISAEFFKNATDV